MFKSTTIQVHIAAGEPDNPEFLLLKRNDNLRVYPGIWQVVTGTKNNGETAYDTAVREVAEETGISPDIIYNVPFIGSFYQKSYDVIQKVPSFGIYLLEKPEIKISEEHTAFKWVDFDKLDDYLAIPDHLNGTNVFHKYIVTNPNRDIFCLNKK